MPPIIDEGLAAFVYGGGRDVFLLVLASKLEMQVKKCKRANIIGAAPTLNTFGIGPTNV